MTQRWLVLESQNPEYKLDLPLSYPVDEDKGHAKFNRTKHQLTVTLPVRPAPSTGSQRVRRDEMKSSDEEEEEDEADPEPKEDCSTLTRSLQPSASEPQTTALTTEPQTLSDPAVNRTEPQTLSDPAVNRTEPQTLSDPAVNRTEPQTLSDPAVNWTEPQEPDHQICSVETDKDEPNINQPVDRSSNTVRELLYMRMQKNTVCELLYMSMHQIQYVSFYIGACIKYSM